MWDYDSYCTADTDRTVVVAAAVDVVDSNYIDTDADAGSDLNSDSDLGSNLDHCIVDTDHIAAAAAAAADCSCCN